MAKKLERASLPGWPALMSTPLAAAYLDISVTTLKKHVPVTPKHHLGKALYDKAELDSYARGKHNTDAWVALFDDSAA